MQKILMSMGFVALLAMACRSDPPKEASISVDSEPRPTRMVTPASSRLDHFADEQELRAYVARATELEAIEIDHLHRRWRALSGTTEDPWAGVEESVVTGSSPSGPTLMAPTSVVAFDANAGYTPNLEVSDVGTITNNQERGVDEGDIVKRIGDFLIVLRRGRLHSIEIGDRSGDRFRLADVADVFPYPVPHEAWYDEVLVDDDRIVVLGYSYETEATELSIFDLDRSGRIRHRSSHAIRSGDYYSWENYGSRLVDHRLVLYVPIDLSEVHRLDVSPWPVHSTWGSTGLAARWDPLVEEIEVVEPIQAGFPTTLHSVIECDLDAPELDCRARGVVAEGSSVHHVSATAVHLWIEGPLATFDPMAMDPSEYDRRLQEGGAIIPPWAPASEDDEAVLYRIPFDDSSIGAVAVKGAPLDQFSFREADAALDLFLVRWKRNSRESADASWWRVPLASFDRPIDETAGIDVNPLPDLTGGWGCIGTQRFVAAHLLYGDCRESEAGREVAGVHVIELAAPSSPAFIETPGRVDRIEPIVDDALIVASSSSEPGDPVGTHLLPIQLADGARAGPPLFLEELVELENRSHAFNWTHRADGLLMGLPFARLEQRHRTAYLSASIPEPASLIAYFTLDEAGEIARAGELEERHLADPPPEDCDTSCYDWYGSVRPIFLDDRVFGLIGDELAEAHLDRRGIHEIQRLRMRGGRH